MHRYVEIELSVLIHRMFVNIGKLSPNYYNIFINIIVLVCSKTTCRVGTHHAELFSRMDKHQSQHILNLRVYYMPHLHQYAWGAL